MNKKALKNLKRFITTIVIATIFSSMISTISTVYILNKIMKENNKIENNISSENNKEYAGIEKSLNDLVTLCSFEKDSIVCD
jgi:hypothetical protein